MGEPNELEKLQVLIVGGRSHSVQVLRQVLIKLGVRRAKFVSRVQVAIELLRANRYDAVFCDEKAGDAGADEFVLRARRSSDLLNPMVPIFLVCSGPRPREIEAARDLGFTDVLARPLSSRSVRQKLSSAIVDPRPFIVAGEFFGPDRRVKSRLWLRTERRKRKPRRIKVTDSQETEPAD